MQISFPKVFRTFAASVLVLSPAFGADPGAPPLTLKEAFRKAGQSSEQIRMQAERVEQMRARYRQVRGGVLPNVRVIGTSTIQDTSGTGGGGDDGTDVRGTLTQRERSEARINATQPIFQGFKEFAALSSLRADERREELLLQRQATLLFQQVAESFFRVVQLETELVDLRVLMKLAGERIRELQERVELGKSRTSETSTAESQMAIYRAQEAGILGDIAVAREQLSFLIGEPLGAAAVKDDIGLPTEPPPIDDLLQRVGDRSDVAALREEVESRRAALGVAKASYWPSLGVSGNYYLKRPGFQEEIDWDAVFTLSAPIYQGGAVRGLHLEARSRLREAEHGLARQKRLVETDVRQTHALLVSSIEEARRLEDAVKKSRRSYELLVRDYRLGLTNNLDVLQAMNSLQTVKRDFDLARLQSKLNLLNVRLAVEMTPENLP